MWLACSCDPRALFVGRPRHNRRFCCPALLCCHERRRPAHCHGLHHGRHGVGAYGCNDISDSSVIESLQRSRARSGSGTGECKLPRANARSIGSANRCSVALLNFDYRFEDMLSLRVCSSACICVQADFNAPSGHQLGCRGVTSGSQLQRARQGTSAGQVNATLAHGQP